MKSGVAQAAIHKSERLFGPSHRAEVNRHARKHEANLRAYGKAWQSGNRERLKSAGYRTLTSASSKICCLLRVASMRQIATFEELKSIAISLNPYKDCGEAVQVKLQEKSSGTGFRPTCRFGFRKRALQLLCRDMLQVRFGEISVDYMRKGTGPEIASDQILTLVNAGCEFFVCADIKDFYLSIQQAGVRKAMGLPKSVVTNCLLVGPHAPLVLPTILPRGIERRTLDRAVRNRFPQGSLASPYIASVLIGQMLRGILPQHQIVAHGDDIALAVRSLKEAKAVQKALKEALQSSPSGPFCLKRSEIKHINDGFDFLKYHHVRKPKIFGGHIHRHPARICYVRFEDRARKILTQSPTALIATWRYRSYWIRSFRRWNPNVLSRSYLANALVRAYCNASSAQN